VRYANVVLDIPTRSLDGAFCYAVPMGLGSVVVVGTTVLVPFSHRDVVGYVVGITDRPADGVDPDRVLPVRQVLATPRSMRCGRRGRLGSRTSTRVRSVMRCDRFWLPARR